jgi:glycosyltransferase involved in cell wall biosynthesis
LRSAAPANVRFLGQLDTEHVLAEMAKAQVLVFPSECYENMSQVLVEALSMGLPIVASRIGGVPEIIEDGVSGVLFEPGNADALKRALSRMFADPDTLAEMRQEARQRYESHYSEAANHAALVEIYDAARENAKRRKPTND